MQEQRSPGRGGRARRGPTTADSGAISPRDIDINLQTDNRGSNDLSQSDRRKDNAERRSQMAEKHSSQVGVESDDEDIDVKKMKINFDETKENMEIVKQIESDFCNSKKRINKFDNLALEADCSIKTVRQSYRVLKEHLYKQNPNFDQDKTEANIHQLLQAVESDADNLGSLKGEYFATHDTVINKDSNLFKIDQIKRTRAKQLRVLQKFEQVDTDIQTQSDKLIKFEGQFHVFEKKLFGDQLVATTRVVEETNQFMEEIDNQMDKMTQDILKIKGDVSGVTPATKEQIEKLNKINVAVAQVEKILELADEAMERNDQTKEKLQATHEECKEIVTAHEKLTMVEMVTQTRQIEKLVSNLRDWEALYAALKALQENSIEVGDFDLAKAMADAKKYVESVAGGRKDEYDDLIKKIQKAAKNIRDGGEEQQQRLDEFTAKNLDGDIASLIPDQDLLFLTKEVTRYNGSLGALQAQKDETLEDATKIDVDMKAKNKGLTITPEDLHQLRQNLKSLDKQNDIDLPRIKKNIDMLEAFAIKALKNKLNEDNKKSQNQISLMKKNYEDLQKEIDNLNTKLTKVKDESLAQQKRLDNEDKEKDNDIKFKVEDKLGDCDKDINGHKSEQPGEERDNTRPLSLQARKKDIIASINKMVNQFNENNKQIKENNKTPKSEKEMNDLILKNREIQEECAGIDDKVGEGKVFAEQIDERLNNILDPTIPELDAKYDEKNALIDECDDLFDTCEEKLKNIDINLQEQLAKVEGALEKLNDAGPINNPSSSDRDNKDFIKKVSDLTDRGDKLRGELETIQTDMQDCKDRLMEVIQPLNELGDREVKTPEVQKILEKLKQIEGELKAAEADLDDSKKQTDDLNDEVDKLIESEKNQKIQDADEQLGQLDKALAELGDLKKEAQRKLQKYQDMIAAAKGNEGQADPQLMGTLKKLEKEADAIKDQLKDMEIKEKDIKVKREDAKAMIDDAYANPDNYTPQQIDGIIDGVGDLRTKVDGLNEKADKIEQDVDRRIAELKDLLAKNNATKALDQEIAEYLNRMKDDLASLKELLGRLPEQIRKLLETLQEMKKGSVPDESADYWEERKDLDRWIDLLVKQEAALKKIKANFDDQEKKFKNLQAEAKKATEIVAKKTLRDELKKESEFTANMLEEAYDCQDVVVGTQKEMSDCQIPVNIKMRANEIDQFRERLSYITDEFKELKAADDAYEGTSDSEQEIKALIEKIDRKLKSFETEKTQHMQYQKKTLEAYREKDIFGADNAIIVREVRNFKEKIADTNRRLKELDDFLRELNNKLIAQDMENAAKLLGHKSKNLRDRLETAKSELGKISNCGKEMDGNTSHTEEEEFIDALKEEMPEVFKNIEGNFEQLDKIDAMIEEVIKNRDIETMQDLKGQIDDAQTKVEQCEGLVNKLENEIIEWDATKKLCRRDEELGEIDSLLKEFRTDLKGELDCMKSGEKQQTDYLDKAKEQTDIDDANYLLEGIKNYTDEIHALGKDIDALDNDRTDCFGEFDGDVPSSVKVERNKREAAAGKAKKITPSTNSDKPEDMYYKLQINSRYKQRIHDLLKRLRDINQRRRDMMEKYAGLKKDLNVVKAPRVYKAIKGDPVDELWCHHLNKAQIDLEVKRLGPGQYMFGSRKIMCKIINGKLVVRVGGGYMSADEFIEQYGRIEILKAMKMAGHPDFDVARQSLANVGIDGKRSGSNPRGSKVALPDKADMMNLMKKQLDNAAVYEEGARVNSGGIGSGRSGSNKRTTVAAMASPKGSPMNKRQTSAGRR